MINKNIKNNKGFTIIEMMIAIAVFLIVLMIGMGALLNTNLIHQKTQNMRSIMDNLSFIMEDMSRNIRIGSNYECVIAYDSPHGAPLDCDSNSGKGISFKSAYNNDNWYYFISDKVLYKAINDEKVPLTLENEIVLDFDQSGFTVVGSSLTDKIQPFVTIKLSGTITAKDGTTTPFKLQTAVSQRLIDYNIQTNDPGSPIPVGNNGSLKQINGNLVPSASQVVPRQINATPFGISN